MFAADLVEIMTPQH